MTDGQGVTPEDMQQYLNLDTNGDASVLADMISTAEEAIIGAIDDTIAIEVYRTYPLFNQAVRVLVDFMYYSRGTLSDQSKAYPPSYAYMIKQQRLVGLMAKFKVADFSRKVDLGSPKSHKTGAGINITSFVPNYSLHFKQQNRTLTQQYTLVGTRLDNSITVIVRHDVRNASQHQARIDGIVYDISDISPDDSNDAIRYDYLTLVKTTKGA